MCSFIFTFYAFSDEIDVFCCSWHPSSFTVCRTNRQTQWDVCVLPLCAVLDFVRVCSAAHSWINSGVQITWKINSACVHPTAQSLTEAKKIRKLKKITRLIKIKFIQTNRKHRNFQPILVLFRNTSNLNWTKTSIHPNTNISVREGEDTSFLGVCGGAGRGSGLLCRLLPSWPGHREAEEKGSMDGCFVCLKSLNMRISSDKLKDCGTVGYTKQENWRKKCFLFIYCNKKNHTVHILILIS